MPRKKAVADGQGETIQGSAEPKPRKTKSKKETESEGRTENTGSKDEVKTKKTRKKDEASAAETGTEAVMKPRRGRKKKEEAETVEAELVQESNKKIHRYGVNNNLVSFSERSANEAREAGRKGGRKSGETRRAKKNLREFGQWFLNQMASDAFQPLMDRHGVPIEESTNLASLYVRVFNKAMSTGDLNAARQVIEWAGMAPLQEMRENEAIAKMSQVMQLAQGMNEEEEEDNDVVFYIPENGRAVVTDDS